MEGCRRKRYQRIQGVAHIGNGKHSTSICRRFYRKLASTKEEALDRLIGKLDEAGRLTNKEEMKRAILAREAQGSTGIGEGIAIPHAKTAAVKVPSIAFGLSQEGVD